MYFRVLKVKLYYALAVYGERLRFITDSVFYLTLSRLNLQFN